VSEKTLELNICAEVLYRIRQIPGCERAFWIGLKQDQEAKLGIDDLISNIPTGMHLALQFKAPRSQPSNQTPYRFTINDRQNSNLLKLAASRTESVYYILPHYNTFTKMRSDSPNLLKDTWLLKVNDLRGLPISANKQGTHSIETNPQTNPPSAAVHSEQMNPNIMRASDMIETIFDNKASGGLEAILVSNTHLQHWLYELIDEAEGNKFVIGQRLRGFSTFCVS
jgi:hypothetical protein